MTDVVFEPSPLNPAVAEAKAFQQEVAGQIRRSPAHELPKVPGVGPPYIPTQTYRGTKHERYPSYIKDGDCAVKKKLPYHRRGTLLPNGVRKVMLSYQATKVIQAVMMIFAMKKTAHT